ncbi:hypothetical protein P872_18430 [Rhodonellum psychrophilum GCM71 = DSM 17998]|uniref:Uncharacterized protein n=2 Tax=Rhodonellum TaxID=336827 RepID=U5BP98_9BACT|nr:MULTISPECIES: hypothetical protein [Rhodonellum]ERM82375.1 hypothetical protein P872_18430 [Rhodonellum psychrophilum GCM71 = DSM 17998]SDZ35399.1 hypothetical protein SAMN05444412_11141 [Rhodonellum ikkaensis]
MDLNIINNQVINELKIIDNKVQITLNVESDAASRTIIAKNRAIQAELLAISKASEASTSAVNASVSEVAAKESELIAVTKANEANTSEINSKASELIAVEKASEASTSAIEAKASELIAVTKGSESVASAIEAKSSETISVAKAAESVLSASNASVSEVNSKASETLAVSKASEATASAVAANESKIQTDLTFSNTQSLLGNFFNPEIYALNVRGMLESANFEIKLRHVQQEIDTLDYNPDLLMIPSARKDGKLYSVLPADGTGDFTVSRNGTKTVMGKNGLLVTVPANTPALEFNPDGTFKGVLVEPASTNLFIINEDFNNGYWFKSNSSIQHILKQSPFGSTFLVSKLIPNEGVTSARVFKSMPLIANTDYNFSVFVKRAGYDTVSIWFNGSSAQLDIGFKGSTYIADLTTGETNDANLKIVPFNNNWYRISITIKVLASFNCQCVFSANLKNSTSVNNVLGDGVSGIYIWGAQLEIGSVATSYIPTTTATVTRPADIITKNNVLELISKTEGSFYLETYMKLYNNLISGTILYVGDGSVNNRIILLRATTGVKDIVLIATGPTGITVIRNNINVSEGKYKFCVVYNNQLIKLFINGIKISESLSRGSFIGNNIIKLGSRENDTEGLNDHIKTFAISKQALTDAQAITLTTL